MAKMGQVEGMGLTQNHAIFYYCGFISINQPLWSKWREFKTRNGEIFNAEQTSCKAGHFQLVWNKNKFTKKINKTKQIGLKKRNKLNYLFDVHKSAYSAIYCRAYMFLLFFNDGHVAAAAEARDRRRP